MRRMPRQTRRKRAARARPPTTEPAMMPARAPEEREEEEEGAGVMVGSVVEVRVVAGRAEVTGDVRS